MRYQAPALVIFEALTLEEGLYYHLGTPFTGVAVYTKDEVVTNNQVPIADPATSPPSYTVVIPLLDGDYKTIVFDQGAKYNNFNDYKKLNSELKEYCDDHDWNKYCGHCDKEDQKYLTIKNVFPWKRGTLFAFDRMLFHCSANFSKLSKKAIVMWLSYG